MPDPVDLVIKSLEDNKKKKYVYGGPGVCVCGSYDITYLSEPPKRETLSLLSQGYRCNVCGHEGREWYNIEYLETE